MPTPSPTDSSSRRNTPNVLVVRCFSRFSALVGAPFAPFVGPVLVGNSASSEIDSSCRSIFFISFAQSCSAIVRLLQTPSCRRFPRQPIALDLLIEIGAGHIQGPGRLGDVPVERAELGEEKRALGGVLELLECLALEKRAQSRLLRIALPDETHHVVAADPWTSRQDQQTLNRVAELAHIARPVELLETLHRLVGDRARRHSLALGQLIEKMHDKKRNVFPPLAQRRDMNRNDVEPVE